MSTFVELAAESTTLTHRPVKPKPQLIRGHSDREMAYWSAEADEAARAGRDVSIDSARDTLLETESGMRGYLIQKNTSETLAVNLMAKLGRVDLRRCGTALLEWRSAENKQSQDLLWAALERSRAGDLSKPVAGDVLAHLRYADLLDQAVEEKQAEVETTLAKALGGMTLEEGLDTVVDNRRADGIIAAAAALRPLSIAEQLAIHHTDPYSAHVTLAARLVRIENNKEVFDADSWLNNVQIVNRYIEEDQQTAVLGGLIATMKPYIVAAIDRRGGWGEKISTICVPNHPSKLDVALTLLEDDLTPARWAWVNKLWLQTQTAPSVRAAVGTLHRHPELIGLVGAVDVDADSEENQALVATANATVETVWTEQQELEGHNQDHGGVVAELLSRWTLHPHLVIWLLAGNEVRVCNWAKESFEKNLPNVELAAQLATTLEHLGHSGFLWENRNNMPKDIYRALLVNAPGIPDHVRRYGRRHGQENLIEDTLAVFGETFGNNTDKWAQLDTLMCQAGFVRTSSIAETLAQLG